MDHAPAPPPPGDPAAVSAYAQRAAAAAAASSASRFVEGSMNDRVSAAPPPGFLGGAGDDDEERRIAAFQRQFRFAPAADHRASWQSAAPSASSSSSAARRGFWDGVRERLHLGPAARKGAVETAPPADRPSRDETLANYHELMRAGFFSAHAIQSTRHAPQHRTAPSQNEDSAPPPPPTWAPPPVPPSSLPPAPPRPLPPMPLLAVPRSSTSSAPDYPRPMVRGVKRPLPPDADDGTPARKLVRRLRASASRVGADLTLRRPGSSASATVPPGPALGAPIVFARSVSATHPPPTDRRRMLPRSPGRAPPPGARGGRKLCKTERRRSRSRGRASRSPSAGPGPSPRRSPRRRLSKPGSPMKIDSEPPPLTPALALGSHPPFPFTTNGETTAPAAAPVPSFHFPSRTRPPLSVVPDPNRGIPDVPALPAGLFALPNKHIPEGAAPYHPPPAAALAAALQRQGRKASSGSFRFGARDDDGATRPGWRGIRFR